MTNRFDNTQKIKNNIFMFVFCLKPKRFEKKNKYNPDFFFLRSSSTFKNNIMRIYEKVCFFLSLFKKKKRTNMSQQCLFHIEHFFLFLLGSCCMFHKLFFEFLFKEGKKMNHVNKSYFFLFPKNRNVATPYSICGCEYCRIV